jgi:hypothetical protein
MFILEYYNAQHACMISLLNNEWIKNKMHERKTLIIVPIPSLTTKI